MLPQNNDRNGGIYEQHKMQTSLCSTGVVPAVGLRDGNHGLCRRHRRCGRCGGKHMADGIRSDQDRGEQCSLSRHRPDPGGILLRQVGDGLFRLQKKRPVRVDGARHFVRVPGVHADSTTVHLADHRNLRYRQ